MDNQTGVAIFRHPSLDKSHRDKWFPAGPLFMILADPWLGLAALEIDKG